MSLRDDSLGSIDDLGSGTLTPGTASTVISNTAATPIAGTFSNLADNSTLTVGSNTYLVSYESGDGNDLTLTVQEPRSGSEAGFASIIDSLSGTRSR